jgi:hypothetical protein
MTFRIQQNDIDQNYIQKNDILQKLNQDINNNFKKVLQYRPMNLNLTFLKEVQRKSDGPISHFFAKFDNLLDTTACHPPSTQGTYRVVSGNTKEGSITVLLTSCLTCLESAV